MNTEEPWSFFLFLSIRLAAYIILFFFSSCFSTRLQLCLCHHVDVYNYVFAHLLQCTLCISDWGQRRRPGAEHPPFTSSRVSNEMLRREPVCSSVWLTRVKLPEEEAICLWLIITHWKCTFKTIQFASPLAAKPDKWQDIFKQLLKLLFRSDLFGGKEQCVISNGYGTLAGKMVPNQDRDWTPCSLGAICLFIFIHKSSIGPHIYPKLAGPACFSASDLYLAGVIATFLLTTG